MGCIYGDLIVIQWDVTGSNGIQQGFIMILGWLNGMMWDFIGVYIEEFVVF